MTGFLTKLDISKSEPGQLDRFSKWREDNPGGSFDSFLAYDNNLTKSTPWPTKNSAANQRRVLEGATPVARTRRVTSYTTDPKTGTPKKGYKNITSYEGKQLTKAGYGFPRYPGDDRGTDVTVRPGTKDVQYMTPRVKVGSQKTATPDEPEKIPDKINKFIDFIRNLFRFIRSCISYLLPIRMTSFINTLFPK